MARRVLFIYVDRDGGVTHNGQTVGVHDGTPESRAGAIKEALEVLREWGKLGRYEVIDAYDGATLGQGMIARNQGSPKGG